MRLIDVDEAKRRIIEFATGCHPEVLTVDSIIMLLDKADTVDAVPVVHGRWVGVDYDLAYECSVCGYSTPCQLSNYCPNCGAKMDGGNGDA